MRSICFVIFTLACCCHLNCLYIFIIRFFFFSFATLSFILYTDQFSFIHRCRFIECLASWAHIHIHSELTNGRKKKEGRKTELNFYLQALWMVDARRHLFFFFALSLSRQWLDINGSEMEVDPACIRLANRQNENFDCLPDIDTYT